jgi:hypothetical protein
MASVQFNISKGREVELYNNIVTNSPANSAFVMLVIKTGSAGVNGLVDFDTVAAVLAGGYTEVNNTNYTRKTITDSTLDPWAPDDTNNRVELALPLQSWTNITVGNVWDIVIVAYDPDTTGGTDSSLIPVTAGELRENGTALVPNTSTVVVDFSSAWITAT